MVGKTQKSKNLTFMPVPLTAGEKRDIYRRLSEQEPVVFVEPSASTRKKTDSSNLSSRTTGFTLNKSIVFLNSAFHKKQPDVDVAFGFLSTQKRQRTGLKESNAAVSFNSSASCNREASTRPTNIRRTKKAPEQRECKNTAPSEEPEKQQVKPKDLIGYVTNLINRLTPESLQDSLRQLKNLNIEAEESLKSVISIIFERALLRPNSSALYASLCQCISKIQVSSTADPTASVSFRTSLMRHCRAEFEQNHGKNYIFERRQRRLETAKDEEELEQMRKELDEAKASRRSINNIRFIGELFKTKILSAAVMHSCITTLLKNRDEESLECLCELFRTVGKDLEVATAKRDMDVHFNRMETIGKEGKTSSRVCLLLKDTMDLRERNWSSDFNVTCIMGKGTDNQPSASAAQTADPVTSPGQTGCREPQTEDADSGSVAQPHLTPDKKEDGDKQLQQKKKKAVPTDTIPLKHSQTEDDMEKISEDIINEYIITNNLEEALHQVTEQTSPSLLHVFVRSAVDLTFECSSDIRRNTGLLLLEMHKSGLLPAAQIFKGLQEILEVADYIAEDLPEVWLSLAELISPMLHRGGVSMSELHGKIQALVPLPQASVLQGHIVSLLPNNSPSSTPPPLYSPTHPIPPHPPEPQLTPSFPSHVQRGTCKTCY